MHIFLNKEIKVSRIIHGNWRLLKAGFENEKSLLQFIEQLISLGVTTFDHADIYGDFECERTFGNALKLNPSLRANIQLITKCGIMPLSQKFPDRAHKYYSYTPEHINASVENSLRHFGTDYIDILLLHRPSPLVNYEAVANVFSTLHQQGKVRGFGVSNFSPQQFATLNSFCEHPLISNQVEISVCELSFFRNGNVEFMQQNKVYPMAWSPLSGGKIFDKDATNPQIARVQLALSSVAKELNLQIDEVAYSWLLSHPVQILPIVGTNKVERIASAVKAINHKLTEEQWLRIYTAGLGEKLP